MSGANEEKMHVWTKNIIIKHFLPHLSNTDEINKALTATCITYNVKFVHFCWVRFCNKNDLLISSKVLKFHKCLVNSHQLPRALVLQGKLHDQLLKGVYFDWSCQLIWVWNPVNTEHTFSCVRTTCKNYIQADDDNCYIYNATYYLMILPHIMQISVKYEW